MAPESEGILAPLSANPLKEPVAIPAGGPIPPVAESGMSAVPAVEPVAIEPTMPAIEPTMPIPLPLPSVPPAEDVARLQILAPPQVAAGEEFTIHVSIQGARDLYSAPLFVFYDAQNLEFVGAQEGEFLRADGQSTIFTTSPNAVKGELIVGYKQGVGGIGASGDGSLFTLDFRAKTPGEALIALDRLNFRTPEGNRLPIASLSATVEIR